MSKLEIERYDAADYLKDEQAILAYLNVALDDGHPDVVAQAIGNVARARGMSRIAKRCGLGRESLYKSLSDKGNPEFRTVVSVLRAMGMHLRVEAATTNE